MLPEMLKPAAIGQETFVCSRLEMAREEREVEEPERPEHSTWSCWGIGRPHSMEEAGYCLWSEGGRL